ncbi:hypothetical protein [Pseudomonas sp. NPDC089401]|uniref:hypothetical protein n=1 Tax=Pseudomonas sp. NPDC089401 TaxID=3364462 RepID=UPI003809E8EF
MDASQIISTFGIAVPICATVAAWFWKTHHERKAVKVALIAEILALREIATTRRYVEELEETAQHLRGQEEGQREITKYQVKVPEHYCRIYINSVTKLGALKLKDAQLVVKFYQYADSFIMDVAPGGNLYEGTDDPAPFTENAAILREAIKIADELKRRNSF